MGNLDIDQLNFANHRKTEKSCRSWISSLNNLHFFQHGLSPTHMHFSFSNEHLLCFQPSTGFERYVKEAEEKGSLQALTVGMRSWDTHWTQSCEGHCGRTVGLETGDVSSCDNCIQILEGWWWERRSRCTVGDLGTMCGIKARDHQAERCYINTRKPSQPIEYGQLAKETQEQSCGGRVTALSNSKLLWCDKYML